MGALDHKTRRRRRNRLAAELAATYHPRKHFRLGQDIGWHWQFDDPLKRVGIPYEWTDTAGTTPVTAVGQGIGLLLGREYGGATGPSLLANGTTGLTGTATAASYNTSTFAGSVSRAGDASNQSWVTWTGLTTSAVYRLRITNTGATSLDVRNGGVAGTIVASIAAGASTWVHPATTGGSTSITITATANSTTATFTLGQFAVLPGTHLIQATGTAKPTLSALVNRLIATEAMNGASWTKGFGGTAVIPVITDGYTTDDEGKPASRVQLNKGAGSTLSDISNFSQVSTGSVTGASYKARFKVKATSAGEIGKVILFRQAAGSGYVQITLTSSWQEVVRHETAISTSITYDFALRGTLGSSNSADFLVSQIDLRTADDAAKLIPAYQRVGATAADHDTDGFPHFARADGTDDCWASVATVDGSATDKLTVVAAVTKNSDAAVAVLMELTADATANNGGFYMAAPPQLGQPNYGLASRGSASVAVNTATSYAAPITSVLTFNGDIGADVATLQVGSVQAATSSSDQGTGNYANATLNVLSRAGSSFRFNGRFYGSTGRFGSMSDSERNNLNRWWRKRIGTA